MSMTFYDHAGRAAAYAEDDVHIFLYTGHPVGYIVEGSIYAFSGRHLGTLRAGWVRDHAGLAVLCTEEAVTAEALAPPQKLDKPPKMLKKPKPAKDRRELPPDRPEEVAGWSASPPEALFRE